MASERSTDEGIVALDTNVLVYAFVGEDARAERAEDLLRGRPWISVQALNELVNVLRRKRALSWAEVAVVVDTVTRLCLVADQTLESHRLALQLVRRYSLSWWDALHLAVALDAGVTVFFSEDLHDGLVVENQLRISNPFRANG